eukprot:Gb_18763 [translate_table: standard]
MEIVQATLFQTFPFHSSAVSSITKSCQSTGKPSALPLISISAEKNEEHFQNQLYNRRNLLSNALVALLGGFTLSAGHCRPAQAFSLGICKFNISPQLHSKERKHMNSGISLCNVYSVSLWTLWDLRYLHHCHIPVMAKLRGGAEPAKKTVFLDSA